MCDSCGGFSVGCNDVAFGRGSRAAVVHDLSFYYSPLPNGDGREGHKKIQEIMKRSNHLLYTRVVFLLINYVQSSSYKWSIYNIICD